MIRRLLPLPLLLLLVGAAPDWRRAEPGYAWDFPADHRVHPEYRNEWWYATGLLEGEDAEGTPRRFGWQVTFFRVGLSPAAPGFDSAWDARDLVMAHAALTDLDAGRHVFTENLVRAVPLLGGFGAAPDSVLAWCAAPPGTPGRWTFRLSGKGFATTLRDDRLGIALDLDLQPTRPRVFHGTGGFSPKSADGEAASLYYTHTRLATAGTVRAAGETLRVVGSSWLDREIFTGTLGAGQVGWDWFALRLDDGRDLMLYRLRDAEGGTDFARGTLVEADGVIDLTGADWRLDASGSWRSPATDAEYPSGWRLALPGHGLDLQVVPVLAGQENVSVRSGLHYWEGAVEVVGSDGRRVGEGYVELTGYGRGNRPPI